MNPPVEAVAVSPRDVAMLQERARTALDRVQLSRLYYARLIPENMDTPADDVLIEGQEAIRSVVAALDRIHPATLPETAGDSLEGLSLGALVLTEDPKVQEARQALSVALRAAIEAANELDRLEGNWFDGPTGPGEPQGTNYAESLHMVACRLSRNDAPKGRD